MKWSQFNRANARRHALIDKKFTVGLTPREMRSKRRVEAVTDRMFRREHNRSLHQWQQFTGKLNRLEAEIDARIELRRKEAGDAE